MRKQLDKLTATKAHLGAIKTQVAVAGSQGALATSLGKATGVVCAQSVNSFLLQLFAQF